VELHVFARFHAAAGRDQRMSDVLHARVPAVRQEPGCLYIEACRSTRDPALFLLFSRWEDEPAFQVHAELQETNAFIATMESLSDRPVDVHRSRPLSA